MVKNRKGFADAPRYGIKPDFYDCPFNGWCAHYMIDGVDYKIDLHPKYKSDETQTINIYKRVNGKWEIGSYEQYKSIKDAVDFIKIKKGMEI